MLALRENGYFHNTTTISKTIFGKWNEVGKECVFNESEIGNYTYFGDNCDVINTVMGKFCSIGKNVKINPYESPENRTALHRFSYRKKLYNFSDNSDCKEASKKNSKRVTIGNDVFIGHGAIIMPGVTVGNGAIIGAGSIVTRDVPAYSVAVGVPASVIRMRYDESTIEKLEEIKWWNWTHEELKERVDDFSLPGELFADLYGNLDIRAITDNFLLYQNSKIS